MKILILVHNLTGGGGERVASLWATGFVERGYEVGMVLNSKRSTPITFSVPDAVKIYNLRGNNQVAWVANKMYRRLHIDYYYTRRLKTVLQDFQPDVAIGVLQPWAEWTRKASKGMNIKIINTEHNSFERPESAPMTSQMRKQKFEWNNRYEHVTVLTKADMDVVANRLNNVTVLPNPLTFEPVAAPHKKEKVILAVGRLNAGHYKGFDVLIKAFGMTNNDWILQIAGAGHPESVAKYRTLADECGVGNRVQFLGFIANLIPIYQRASIFVLSSRYEGFGMVLIEAMSQGCAPIACDYKGRQREIITSDEEGIICPVDDVGALAKAIDRMIEDDEYRHQTQRNAIERSKYYSLDNIMDRWEEIFREMKLQ